MSALVFVSGIVSLILADVRTLGQDEALEIAGSVVRVTFLKKTTVSLDGAGKVKRGTLAEDVDLHIAPSIW